MTAKTMEQKTPTDWAEQAGRQVAERRAARDAQAQAEAARDGARLDVPLAVLGQRFAATAAILVEAIDAHARAAGIPVTAESVLPPVVELRAGDDVLTLRLDDDVLRVTFRSRSWTEDMLVDLADTVFAPEPAARRVASRWFLQLDASHGGGPHAR